MSLDRGAERPEVHAVGPDADRPAPAAGAEGQDLVEAIEQAGPLLLFDEPLELRPVGANSGAVSHWVQEFDGLVLEGGVSGDGADACGSGGQPIHVKLAVVLVVAGLDAVARWYFTALSRTGQRGNITSVRAGIDHGEEGGARMTVMKDLVTPEGRLRSSRINCHDVYHYLKCHRPHTEITLALQIFPEDVLALIHYIVEHEEEVEANWQAFEAEAAKGNPPEIQAKLEQSHKKLMAMREAILARKAQEAGRGESTIDGLFV